MSLDVPVKTAEGQVEWLPVADDETSTFQIIVKSEKADLLDTEDPNGDRIYVGALSLEEAVGKVLMENPNLSYNDILDHFEA